MLPMTNLADIFDYGIVRKLALVVTLAFLWVAAVVLYRMFPRKRKTLANALMLSGVSALFLGVILFYIGMNNGSDAAGITAFILMPMGVVTAFIGVVLNKIIGKELPADFAVPQSTKQDQENHER